MNVAVPIVTPNADPDLLMRARSYLTHRENGLPSSPAQEAAWSAFYGHYARKIRVYAFSCGATDEEIVDCVQEVWRELLVRLPMFQLDPRRGQFDTWLYSIVQGKTADLHRARKRRLVQGNADTLPNLTDPHPSPCRALEEEEMVALAWDQLRKRLSECNYQVLHLRLVEQRPVGDVAEKLGLSHEQVWYRYHRARRELEEIGLALACGQYSRIPADDPSQEKKAKNTEFAQGKTSFSVSRNVHPSSLERQGGNCVDYVFQRLELGRRELNPEWKVEWNCDGLPRPVLYIRNMAIVAYAEICGPGDFIITHWPQIVNAAIVAGVAAGVATIIATPTAALPIFQTGLVQIRVGEPCEASLSGPSWPSATTSAGSRLVRQGRLFYCPNRSMPDSKSRGGLKSIKRSEVGSRFQTQLLTSRPLYAYSLFLFSSEPLTWRS